MSNKKTLVEVKNLKAYTQKSFSKDGETVNLKVTFHDSLKELINKAVIEDLKDCQIYLGENNEAGQSVYFKFKRYAVKRIFYSELSSNYNDCLFVKDLLKKGEFVFKFGSIYYLNEFKVYFSSNLKKLIEMLLGENVKQEIEFKLIDSDD